ncbi:MAG TPA: cbb3-type cytochrome c oxidase subunit I [Syntrophorhabdaceae bacterium]|nr:cbb3-type cytochrome c oxidase subunit I [Syntrophorhabdaceae bacterium]
MRTQRRRILGHVLKTSEEQYLPVAGFFLSSAFWFATGTIGGLILATEMVSPDFPLFKNVSWLVFSRVRPMHTNIMLFGFVGSGLFGAIYYFVPHLTRRPLFSVSVARATLWLWNLSVAAGTVTLGIGLSQGREYAEYIWPIDIAMLLSFALGFYNLYSTTVRRRENILYVSIWYALGAFGFFFFIYLFGNAVWNPASGAITGMPDGILAWFYGHGIVGLFLTPLAVGVSYYVLPIVCRVPLFSHTLSLVGFWTILMFYPHIGTHHLLQTPAPMWLKIVAVTGSIGMLVPVATVLVNLWLTIHGRLGHLHEEIGGKLVFAGLVWYLLVCLQGPFQSLPSVQRITHLTNWVIAHSHIAVLGFSGFIAVGGAYFILPRITGRDLYSRKLADIQYWLMLTGLTGFFVVLTIAGMIQGSGWRDGEVLYRILPELHVYFVYRLGFGTLIAAGAFVGLYNHLRSLSARHTEDKL